MIRSSRTKAIMFSLSPDCDWPGWTTAKGEILMENFSQNFSSEWNTYKTWNKFVHAYQYYVKNTNHMDRESSNK